MTTILILGGYGFTGLPLARHLLSQTAANLVLAGRRLTEAQQAAGRLNAQYPGERVSALCVDAADLSGLCRALRGVDFLLVAAPVTAHAGVVIRAALESGVDYLDVQLGAQKLALLQAHAAEIERAGLCFITEAGFHPGLPAALVHYAARRFDRLDRAVTAAYLNMGQDLPYSTAVDELMEVFQYYQGRVYKGGSWTKDGAYDTRRVDFGGAIGKRLCFSMFFEELRALPQIYPSLTDVGFYMSGTHWLVDWVISPLVMVGLRLFPQRGRRPLGRLLWWGMQKLPRPPYTVLLQVTAHGEIQGRPAEFFAAVSHPDGYELTAIPVAACLLQVLDGTARRPGLSLMGHLVEPHRFFKDMQRLGVKLEENLMMPGWTV